MNYRLIILLVLIAGSGFMVGACSKANLGVPPAPNAALTQRRTDEFRPLWLIDNVEVEDIKQAKISPTNIESINVLRPSEENDLVSTFGPKAKDGVILVTTKKSK